MPDLKGLVQESLELGRTHRDRTHVWDAIVWEVVRHPEEALKFLALCTDEEFATAGEVLEEVADQVGVAFIERVEELAAQRPDVDISAGLCLAKEVLFTES